MVSNEVQDEKISQIKDRTYEIECRTKWLEEHYTIWNGEFGEIKSDVKWLKKAVWFIGTTSIGTMITLIFNLIAKIL